jgi:CubicO group peptidase (beta-lactamase class C family)
MNSSYWFLDQIPHDNISKPHRPEEGEQKKTSFVTMKHYGYPDYPDGQLRTTVRDYSHFIMLILNQGVFNGKQLFQQQTIKDFLSIQFPTTAPYQAMAWNYNEFDNWIYYLLMPRLPSHTGVDPGVATVVSFDPETKSGAIIFANTLTTSFKGHKILYQEMVKKLLKQANSND